jgi:hypothetical protein
LIDVHCAGCWVRHAGSNSFRIGSGNPPETCPICGHLILVMRRADGQNTSCLQAESGIRTASPAACHAEGRGFEPLQPLSKVPARRGVFAGVRSADIGHLGRMEAWWKPFSHPPDCDQPLIAGLTPGCAGYMHPESLVPGRAIPLEPCSIHFRFGDGLDGRRQIGSTPAGGGVGEPMPPASYHCRRFTAGGMRAATAIA